jgi:carboxypeptidase C (cathepsin A)
MLKTLAFLGLVAFASADAPADKVTSLPQMGTFSFNLYSGYLPVNQTTRSLHYMFAESQGNPATDPVVIWFNGGPGCSSMLGFTQEHGPFVMDDGTTTFHANNYTWNKEASMLYIESPAGVGFSYCNQTTPCNYDDDQSAADNLAAILYFFNEKFPEY